MLLPPLIPKNRSNRALLIRLWCIAQVGFDDLEAFGEQRLGFSIIHSRSDDAILSIFPIGRCRDLELRGQLKRVNDSQEFVKISVHMKQDRSR